MPKDEDRIIASSPIVQGDGQLANRIVIRNLGQKFAAVHTADLRWRRSPSSITGNYFPDQHAVTLIRLVKELCMGAF